MYHPPFSHVDDDGSTALLAEEVTLTYGGSIQITGVAHVYLRCLDGTIDDFRSGKSYDVDLWVEWLKLEDEVLIPGEPPSQQRIYSSQLPEEPGFMWVGDYKATGLADSIATTCDAVTIVGSWPLQPHGATALLLHIDPAKIPIEAN